MQWTCKYCTFCAEKRGYLFKHYRLKHGIHTQTSPLPCLYKDCLYTFKSFNALKVHLSMWHAQKDGGKGRKITFLCQLCDFVEPCNEVDFFTHLRRHLKLKQKVSCPYQGCNFKSNIYSTFNFSETALQDVIEQINQIHLLSQPLIHSSIQRILHQSDDYLVNEIVKIVTDNNAFLKCTSSRGSLSTTSKRTAYILIYPISQ